MMSSWSAASLLGGGAGDARREVLRPYGVAKAALDKLNDGGSITFFSGVLSRRPGMNCSGLGALNGAIESLCYGLALELGPRLRVNCVSPGMVRFDAYSGMEWMSMVGT